MARKAELLPAIERDDTEVIDFFVDAEKNSTEASDKAEALADALKESEDSFVTIHRSQGGGNIPEEFVQRLPADKFDYGQIQDYLATHYGGGDYRIRLYVRKKLKGNKLISIAAPIDKTATSPAGEAAGILSVVLNQIKEQNRQMMQLLAEGQGGNNRMAFLQEMMLMKQLFDTGGNKSGVTELLGAVDALKTLGVSIGAPEPKEEDSFSTLLEKMSPVIEAAIQQPKQPTHEQREKQMNMMQSAILRAKIEPFIKAAIKNSDQAVYAEMICDQLSEAQINEYLLQPASIDQLMTLDKRLPLLRPWFELLVEHVKAQLGRPSTVGDLYDNDENDNNAGVNITPDGENE